MSELEVVKIPGGGLGQMVRKWRTVWFVGFPYRREERLRTG